MTPPRARYLNFPADWEFIKNTDPATHNPACSWVTSLGAWLCSCHVLDAEYERRKLPKEQPAVGYRGGGPNG